MAYYFVTRYFYPDESSGNTLLLSLTRKLAKNDNSINILTSNRVRDSQIKLSKNEAKYNMNIIRLGLPHSRNQNLAFRLFDYGLFLIKVFIFILFKLNKDDVLISMSDPPFLSVVSGMSCRLKKIKQTQWVQDVFPELASSTGLKIPLLNTLIFLRNWSMNLSYKIVVISDEMRDFFIHQGIDQKKIHLIPNWIDENEIYPVKKEGNNQYSKFIRGDKFVVGYSGNMGLKEDFESLLYSAKELKDFSGIEFLFIGSGNRKNELEDYVKLNNLKNVKIHPLQKKEILNYTLNIPDIHAITLLEKVSPYSYPSKIYGVMATGKPLIFIGEKDCEMYKFIETNGIGISVENQDKEQLLRVIKELYENKDLREEMSDKSRKLFLSKYTFEASFKKWSEVLYIR